ncbi:MAG: N-acetylmuramoyl-L-alanine amidase [Hyphomicrobium aestuarii]|nr:N-acetylmuramoyl-L-alanine amidase [Hyphomicrobium aestuarii]
MQSKRAIACGLTVVLALAWAGPVAAEPSDVSPMQLAQVIAKADLNAKFAKPAPVRTRFIIGLEKPVAFQISSLANPNRVIVELPDGKVALPDASDGAPIGFVRSFRAGQASDGRMRVVIEVTEPVIVTSSAIEKNPDGKGHRLAIEIASTTEALDSAKPKAAPRDASRTMPAPSGLGAVGLQPPLPTPAMSPKKKAERAYKPVIVIDPGHGGQDSGATKYGAVEKDVVLAFALVLRDKLQKTGNYKVLMTRDTDTFVELDDRLEFGEKNDAALFIAVHADYAKSNARGATIFSLRSDVVDDLKSSARGTMVKNALTPYRANAIKKVGGEQEVGAIRSILSDLAAQEVSATKDRSKLFAGTVIEKMGDATEMRSSPEKQATFRVLQTAQFPSVLIELAYVTNRKDAENLKSDEWRHDVANSMKTAIDNYFGNRLAKLPM